MFPLNKEHFFFRLQINFYLPQVGCVVSGASNEVPARGTFEALESSEEGPGCSHHLPCSHRGQTWQNIWPVLPSSSCAYPDPCPCRALLMVLSLLHRSPCRIFWPPSLGIAPRLSLQVLYREEVMERAAVQSWGLRGWAGKESRPESLFLSQFPSGLLEGPPNLRLPADSVWHLEYCVWSKHLITPTPFHWVLVLECPQIFIRSRQSPAVVCLPTQFTSHLYNFPLFSGLQKHDFLRGWLPVTKGPCTTKYSLHNLHLYFFSSMVSQQLLYFLREVFPLRSLLSSSVLQAPWTSLLSSTLLSLGLYMCSYTPYRKI